MAGFAKGFGLYTPPFRVGLHLACAVARVSPDVASRQVWPPPAASSAVPMLAALIPWLSTGIL